MLLHCGNGGNPLPPRLSTPFAGTPIVKSSPLLQYSGLIFVIGLTQRPNFSSKTMSIF